MAPKAPTGAAWTMMRITPKNTRAAASIAPLILSPSSPRREMANPVRIETSRTCKRSPRASAPKKLSGMMAMRWATMPSFLGAGDVAGDGLGIERCRIDVEAGAGTQDFADEQADGE